MSHVMRMRVLFLGPVSVLTMSLITLILASNLIGVNEARADQPPPPPPTYYTLTVNKSGGNSTCEVRIDSPVTSAWTSSSVQDTYLAGTEYEPTHRIVCPSGYRFSHWESNDPDLDGWKENRAPDFTLSQNTMATAIFEPVILPNAESTEWHDHYTQDPHIADMYWHRVSLSSEPARSFSGLTINEDFLTSEMDTSGCSMTLTQAQKLYFQTRWDSDWKIDENNYRAEEDSNEPDDKYDSHGFNPNNPQAVWSQIQTGEVFKLKQRMRVRGCASVNNEGPWFATHIIEYKVIYNAQLGKKEVFVKKSGVQGAGDPSF